MIADPRAALLDDLVRERRSIRHFQPIPVPEREIADILRVALWAPSPHNVQPWRFTVLRSDVEKASLADAMASRLAEDLRRDALAAETIEQQTARSRRRVTTAPVVVLCSLVADGLVAYEDERRTALEWQMAVQSLGAVLQTCFLAAATRGIGTCWMAAPMYCADAVRGALGLPDAFAPQALMLMGYPAAPGKVRDRRAFHEVVDFR